MTKALQGRFDQYCEPASLAVIAVLPRDHAKKLKKSVKRWVSEDLQSGGYAALAMIAHHDNDPGESEAMWRKACECRPSVESMLGWAKWCRDHGNNDQAALLEVDAVALLKQ